MFYKPQHFGKVPAVWKTGKYSPFLQGKKEDSGCYRPVSLTLVPGKMLEQILMDTRLRHMENKGVTGPSQNGFTKGKSCLTNSVVLYNRVTALMEKGRATNFIYLDLCKAYDTVLRDILVSKLKSHEFDNATLSGYGVSWIVALKELRSTARCPSGDQLKWCSSGGDI